MGDDIISIQEDEESDSKWEGAWTRGKMGERERVNERGGGGGMYFELDSDQWFWVKINAVKTVHPQQKLWNQPSVGLKHSF